MKKICNLICVVIALACCLTTVGCGGVEKSEFEAFLESPSATRRDFTMDFLKSNPEINYKTKDANFFNGPSLELYVDNIAGYEDFEYVNCEISVSYSLNIIYEDHSEESITGESKIKLDFDATAKNPLDSIDVNKNIQSVYILDVEYKIVSGTIIRK